MRMSTLLLVAVVAVAAPANLVFCYEARTTRIFFAAQRDDVHSIGLVRCENFGDLSMNFLGVVVGYITILSKAMPFMSPYILAFVTCGIQSPDRAFGDPFRIWQASRTIRRFA